MKHVVNYRSATDTGKNESDAIRPIINGEPSTQDTYRRPTEHVRVRTEVLRDLARQNVILADIDRVVSLWGGGNITFNGAYAGGAEGVVTFVSTLYVSSLATPGGGASVPYLASTKASRTIGTPATNQMLFESVKKQWEGSAFPEADADAISIEIVHTGDPSITVTVSGPTGEENNIKAEINYGTHTCLQLKQALDASGAAAALISTTVVDSDTATAPKWDETDWAGDYSARFLYGGAAGIIHEIASGVFTTFFATSANRLRKGDTLAIGYDTCVDESSTGGRFQSTPENSNIALTAGQLFNTRREPERIPGCIPICKCIDDNYVLFSNGAQIKISVPGTLTVDSDVNTAIAGGSGGAEVIAARTSTVYGAFASLDDRLEAGDGEVNTARTSAYYNGGLPYASLSLRLEAEASEVATARGAEATLDARISAIVTTLPDGAETIIAGDVFS